MNRRLSTTAMYLRHARLVRRMLNALMVLATIQTVGHVAARFSVAVVFLVFLALALVMLLVAHLAEERPQ